MQVDGLHEQRDVEHDDVVGYAVEKACRESHACCSAGENAVGEDGFGGMPFVPAEHHQYYDSEEEWEEGLIRS